MFPEEFPLFYRELGAGLYSTPIYYVARIIALVIIVILLKYIGTCVGEIVNDIGKKTVKYKKQSAAMTLKGSQDEADG